MSQKSLKYILFGDPLEGYPLSCFKVGLSNCTAIESLSHGKDKGDIEIYSYRVRFKTRDPLEIEDTVYVSD